LALSTANVTDPKCKDGLLCLKKLMTELQGVIDPPNTSDTTVKDLSSEKAPVLEFL